MADESELSGITSTPPHRDSSTAPFIYFDIAPTFGVFAGAVQIEIASRVLIPRQEGGVDVHFLTTGHLRCSPAAAAHLRDAINQALGMFAQPHEQPTATGRLN